MDEKKERSMSNIISYPSHFFPPSPPEGGHGAIGHPLGCLKEESARCGGDEVAPETSLCVQETRSFTENERGQQGMVGLRIENEGWEVHDRKKCCS
jgi:hypothetical protein